MAENGKIRMPESGNPSLPPPTGSYYLWLSTDGFFKKMDSAGNVSNLSAQSFDDLNDVDLTGLQDGQGIAWNESQQKWEPVTFPEGGGDVESVNGKTGAVVLNPDDLDDSATDHKFASQSQLDQIATNAGDISSLETDVGSLETQVNTNTNDISSLQTDVSDLGTKVDTNTNDISTNATNIALNATNIAANANAISANASDISDLQDQIDGGVGKTYTGVEAIEVNNTDDQISLKLTEDDSGQFDTMTVSGFNSDFNHNFEVVKRDGERVNIDLDLAGQNIILNYDTGTHQLYRCLTHDDMFIGYCDEIGYWIAVKLTVSHTFDVELNGSATLGLQNWVQLGTLSTLLGNGNYVPTSSYLSYTGFAINNSYLSQSASGLTANVSSDLSAAQAYELADALDVKQSLDLKITDPDTSLQVNRPYYLERTLFNNDILVDTWVQTSTLNDDPRWTADPVKLGQDAGLTNQSANSVAIGYEAGSDTQGEFGVAIGFQAGQTTQQYGGVAIGNMAGNTNQGAGAFAFGQNAGNSNQGDNAVGLGAQAGQTSQGVQCLALGFNAGQNTQGNYSVAIGRDSGSQTQSSNSVAIGNSAGKTTQGSLSVAIGYNTGLTNQATRAIAIGNGAGLTNQPTQTIVMANGGNIVPTSTNRIVIGASNYAVQIGDGNVSSASDARDKYDIQDIPLGLDFVNALQPKFYKYDIRELYEETDDNGVLTKRTPDRSKAGIRYHSGFLAQDVKAAMDQFGVDFGVYRDEAVKAEEVHKERATGKLSLCYREFIAIQTKAIQELSSKVSLLESRIEELEGK